MEIKNSKVLLTIIEKGQIGKAVSNSNSKLEKFLVKTSPYEYAICDKNGIPTEKYVTPKGHYKAPNNFVAREEQKCVIKNMLSENVVNYFISENSCPIFDKKEWTKMSEMKRLEYHLMLNAGGKEFKYEIIQ